MKIFHRIISLLSRRSVSNLDVNLNAAGSSNIQLQTQRHGPSAYSDEVPLGIHVDIPENARMWSAKTTSLLNVSAAKNYRMSHISLTQCPPSSSIQRNIKQRRKFMTPSSDPLSPRQVHEIIAHLGRSFAHFPYAICGTSALVYYGNITHVTRRVHILCTVESVGILKSWAVEQGMPLSPLNENDIGVYTEDGILRCIRIVSASTEEMAGLTVVHDCMHYAKVLNLPTLVDSMAEVYMRQVADQSKCEQALRLRDIRWALQEIINREDERHFLEAERLNTLSRMEFFECIRKTAPGLMDILSDGRLSGGQIDEPVRNDNDRRDDMTSGQIRKVRSIRSMVGELVNQKGSITHYR
ncbi:hypothetical protein QQS21_005331 [Conoideocrella luteorostrata]|uniref:Uncharacterized protein n=1 Tax=Conoideocrella luteorostrata TaxID=1105319 RepID=A0AAJ0CPP8_9HYPO|nr:hypothetical protein QQS21_005331 [Conoideocrella luteorostrata]